MRTVPFIHTYRIPIICVIGLGFLYFLIVLDSQSFKDCIQNPAANQNHQYIENIFSFFHCNVIFFRIHVTIISALGLLLITFGLFLSGIVQISTARTQLRAYISVDEVEDPDSRHIDPGTTGILKTLALMTNLGSTPALRVQFALGLQTIPGDLPAEIFKTAKWGEKQIVHPKQKVIVGINDSAPITPAEWAMIRAKTVPINIYVFGIVRYEDIFGSQHFTQFCFKVDYRNGPVRPPGWDWYKDYNKTDDQKEYFSDYIEALLRRPFRWGIMVGAILNSTD